MIIFRKWWLKCVIQILLSSIPGGRNINRIWSRKKIIHSFDLHKFQQALHHVKILETTGFFLKDKIVLEYGAGQSTIIPYVYRIAGCKKIIMCDLNYLLTYEAMKSALQHIKKNVHLAAESLGISVAQAKSVLPDTKNTSFESLLKESGFEYYAPFDMRHTSFKDNSIDCVVSRAVLEHIPKEDIKAIMLETKRILKPSGLMIHTIDHSDHWQHFDQSISQINYLKFSDKWWRIINSSISYQNRLRSCEHVQLIEDSGFNILKIESLVNDNALLDANKKIALQKHWKHMSPEQVAILTTHLVASKQKEGVF